MYSGVDPPAAASGDVAPVKTVAGHKRRASAKGTPKSAGRPTSKKKVGLPVLD